MNRNTKIIFTILAFSVLIALLAFTYTRTINPASEPNQSTNWPDEVDWPTAIEIINSGQVTEVIQLHNLEVKLTLEEGIQIKTIEPVIDEIFIEIELCGDICSDIQLITE
jgi:hypothetical protein